MKKNVLILCGSPRKQGNTIVLASAFAEGAKSAGHDVTLVDFAGKKMSGCIACETCWSRDSACSIQDDFTKLEPLLEQADVLVLASPLYFFGLSTQVKAPIDRLFAYNQGEKVKKPLHIKESVLLMCGETGDPADFEGAVLTYKNTATYMKYQDRGVILACDVYKRGDIQGHQALAQAAELGKSI